MPIAVTDDNLKIRTFLETHSVGVLATASLTGVPYATTIYFAIDMDLNIYFMTKEGTAKNENLQQNPLVALAVFHAPSQTTVQIAGAAVRIDDAEQMEKLYSRVLEVTNKTSGAGHRPPLSVLKAGSYVGYCIKPTTLRMAEFIKADNASNGQLFSEVSVSNDTPM